MNNLSRSFSLCIVWFVSWSCCGICDCMLLWFLSILFTYCVIVSSSCMLVVIWFLIEWKNVVSVIVPLSDEIMLGIIDDGLFILMDGMFLRNDVVMDSVMIWVPVAMS